MKKNIFISVGLICVLVIVLFLICQLRQSEAPVKISAEKPFAFEVKRDRSFFQAQKIQNRLKKQQVNSYIMTVDDTTEGGEWFLVMAEATGDTASIDSLATQIKTQLQIDSVKVIDYNQPGLKLVDIDTIQITEKKRIHESKPQIANHVWDIIYHFPNTDFFYIKDFKLVNFQNKSLFKAENLQLDIDNLDLPRGITLNLLHQKSDAWAEAIYIDNLYGDQVTIDIIRLSEDHNIIEKDSTQTTEADSLPYQIAAFFGKLILDTGEYKTETMNFFQVREKDPLRGIQVMIEPKENQLRTYSILVDQTNQFVYFCQSTQKSTDELKAIMALINRGNGMDEYDEFHNTFFTLPDTLPESELFISFELSRLDWSYAKLKDYTKWSKQMVGHWNGDAFFMNRNDNRRWSLSLFDLLTTEKLNLVYHNYYANERQQDEHIDVYGTGGYFVNKDEVNFPFDRFIASVDDKNTIHVSRAEVLRLLVNEMGADLNRFYNIINNFDEIYEEILAEMNRGVKKYSLKDLIYRANLLQFLPGGYDSTNIAPAKIDSSQKTISMTES